MKTDIKYFIMDVDGTMTDGKIYIGNDGEVMKAFNVKDGYACSKLLPSRGMVPIVITARKSKIVENRCKELGIDRLYQNQKNKLKTLMSIIHIDELYKCAYIGDDISDIESMQFINDHGGVIGCPSDAVREVVALSDYICKAKGGEGAVREFAEWIIK